MKTLTVGAMSKSSSDLPERAAPSCSSGRSSETCSGENSVGNPAVGDLAGERGVLRADRGEVDRDPLLHGGDRQLQRLAGPVGQRQLERLAVELDAFARERHAHHGDVLARALQLLGEALPVPALGDLRAGGADAEDHAPVRELVDRRGGHRGHRGRARRASGRCPSRGGSSRSARRASRARWRCPSRRPRRPTPSRSPAARPPGRSSSWSSEVRPMPQ